MIKYRQITHKDVEIVQELYTKFPDFPQPSLHILPGSGLDGYVAVKDGSIVAACYTYIAANSPTCWIEWVVGDKDYKENDKDDIIIGLLNYVSKEMEKFGYTYLFAMTTNELLEKLYIKAGWDDSGPQGKELLKVMNHG